MRLFAHVITLSRELSAKLENADKLMEKIDSSFSKAHYVCWFYETDKDKKYFDFNVPEIKQDMEMILKSINALIALQDETLQLSDSHKPVKKVFTTAALFDENFKIIQEKSEHLRDHIKEVKDTSKNYHIKHMLKVLDKIDFILTSLYANQAESDVQEVIHSV